MIKTEIKLLTDKYKKFDMEEFEDKMIMEERENMLQLSNQQQQHHQNLVTQWTHMYPFRLNSILDNNMDKYLRDCRYLVSERISKAIPEHEYHQKKFERLSDWEIIEYRYLLEKDIEKGIHALNQVQLLEMLLQERKIRREPQIPYRMGTTSNVSKIVEGLAIALKLRMPTPLVNTTANMLKKLSEEKPYDPRESVQQQKLFNLQIVLDALRMVKGCDLHRDGEIGDLICRFNHLTIEDDEI